jgi:serine phosphatase RsbU (regulator of sigma subunit)
MLYMFSDGYADQFGGSGNKKYKYSTLKDTLLKVHKLPLREQKKSLEKEFYSWKGENIQIDDVLIIGYRI